MEYVKQGQAYQDFKPYLRQTFQNKFSLNIGKNEIIKMKNENVITDRDLEIVKFLFNFKFVTLEQVHLFFGGDYSMDSLKNRMDKLVNYRVLNKFMLAEMDDDKLQKDLYPDALMIYCLDLGGTHLISHYTNFDIYDWSTIVNMKSSEIISKNLIVGTFYLQLRKNAGQKLVYFQVDQDYRVNKKGMGMPLTFCLNVHGTHKYFMVDVVRDCDFPMHFREKAFKIESLVTTNGWKKYFHDTDSPPVLLLIADNDELARLAADLIYESTEMKSVRYTTDERLQNDLYEVGTFMKYVPEEKALHETSAGVFKE